MLPLEYIFAAYAVWQDSCFIYDLLDVLRRSKAVLREADLRMTREVPIEKVHQVLECLLPAERLGSLKFDLNNEEGEHPVDLLRPLLPGLRVLELLIVVTPDDVAAVQELLREIGRHMPLLEELSLGWLPCHDETPSADMTEAVAECLPLLPRLSVLEFQTMHSPPPRALCAALGQCTRLRKVLLKGYTVALLCPLLLSALGGLPLLAQVHLHLSDYTILDVVQRGLLEVRRLLRGPSLRKISIVAGRDMLSKADVGRLEDFCAKLGLPRPSDHSCWKGRGVKVELRLE